ncbi:MAG: DUF4426 domain-containing protein [Gammaproteobacteria bacterium]|jgi:hypothetical protein
MRVCPLTRLAIVLTTCVFMQAAVAERSESFGDYEVHYNALTTDLIDPSVARAYGIIRSKNRVLINVAVLRRVMGMATKPAKATVKAQAVNLNSQLKSVDMRELNDAGAIYYIGELPVDHNETLEFKIEVTPEGESSTHTTSFKQQFYTE